MDFDVLDSLDDLGYPGSLKDDSAVKAAIEAGPKSLEFTELIEWFSKELQALYNLDSCVNALTDPEDSSSFLLEVSSFLKELHCPYKSLVSGPISQRLLDVQSRFSLLDFLCTELQSARLIQRKTNRKNTLEIEVDDSNIATALEEVISALGLSIDVTDDPILVFCEIEEKLNDIISKRPDLVTEPAMKESLSEEQWDLLEDMYKDFKTEYTVRREMLLTRLDVTIQSFKWGEGSKGKENKILDAYVSRRKKLKKMPAVKLSDVIAARESLFIIEKTSSAELVKNTKSSVNRIVISAVPDRGGRPKEQRPPVEMPNWMKRTPQGGGRGDYCRGGRGGGRGQGKKFRGKGGGEKRGSFDAAGTY